MNRTIITILLGITPFGAARPADDVPNTTENAAPESPFFRPHRTPPHAPRAESDQDPDGATACAHTRLVAFSQLRTAGLRDERPVRSLRRERNPSIATPVATGMTEPGSGAGLGPTSTDVYSPDVSA